MQQCSEGVLSTACVGFGTVMLYFKDIMMEGIWSFVRFVSLVYFLVWGVIAFLIGEDPIGLIGEFSIFWVYLGWALFFLAPVIAFTGYAGESPLPGPSSKTGTTTDTGRPRSTSSDGGAIGTDDYVGFDSDGE